MEERAVEDQEIEQLKDIREMRQQEAEEYGERVRKLKN